MIKFSSHSGINTLKVVQELDITLDEAWDFFSNPKNLSEITPNEMGFNITSEIPNQMYIGQIVSYKVAPILGINLNWVTEITHINNKMFFVDEQRFGPYKMWHHEHHFKKNKDNTTTVYDKVIYKLPYGVFGVIAHKLFIKKRLVEIFQFRNKRIKQLFIDII